MQMTQPCKRYTL